MSLKKQYSPDHSNPGDHSVLEATNRTGSSFLTVVEKETAIGKRREADIRLHDLEFRNKQLDELVKIQRKELADAKATNSKFISIIAHDLRSPFSSIIGVLELLKENLNNYRKNEFEEYVNIAYDSAYNTLNLLDNLLEWAISQGKLESFKPVKINLENLLAEELNIINSAAAQKEILISMSVPAGLNATADLQMTKTVVRNLISNSIKFTNRGGEISIYASKKDRFAEITVEDDGVGIPSNTLRSLFKTDSFHSTNGTNNEKGTGLGLILCKEFIELNGGTISIESEQGKGCKTRFTLPLYIL